MIVHVVTDEVTDTLKAVILCPNLGSVKKRVDSSEESNKTSAPRSEKAAIFKKVEEGEKDGRGGRAAHPDH